MPICRRLALLAVAMGWIVSGVDARADQDENLRRLRSMPLEHRRVLAQNLERFDAMGAADREAIRALDRELARQPDPDRARYLAVLRRYHLWLQRLPKERAGRDRRRPPTGTDGARHQAPCRGTRLGGATPDSRVPPGGRSRGYVPLRRGAMAENLVQSHPRGTREVREGPRAPGPWRRRFRNSLDPSRNIDPPQGQFTAQEEEALVRRMMEKPRVSPRAPWLDQCHVVPPGRSPEATGDAEARKSEPRPESRERPPPAGRNGGPRTFFQNRRASLVHCLAGNYYFIENPPEKVEPVESVPVPLRLAEGGSANPSPTSLPRRPGAG